MIADNRDLLPQVAVTALVPERLAEAKQLSQQLGLPFSHHAYVQLCAMEDKWALKLGEANPVWVDLDVASLRGGRRLSKQDGLVRACKPRVGMKVLDLTAGFGRDAAILHAFGASVTMLERDPIMQVLLKDGLKRAQPSQFELICEEASTYLAALSPEAWPDLIYLDPMHPTRRKTAKVKKHMQSLQCWIKPNTELEPLLKLARSKVKEKVVMKWPSRLPPIFQPHHTIAGKTVRFDVYTSHFS